MRNSTGSTISAPCLHKHPMRLCTGLVNIIVCGSNVCQVTQMIVQPKLKSRYGYIPQRIPICLSEQQLDHDITSGHYETYLYINDLLHHWTGPAGVLAIGQFSHTFMVHRNRSSLCHQHRSIHSCGDGSIHSSRGLVNQYCRDTPLDYGTLEQVQLILSGSVHS
jgi:hypothetical protein